MASLAKGVSSARAVSFATGKKITRSFPSVLTDSV